MARPSADDAAAEVSRRVSAARVFIDEPAGANRVKAVNGRRAQIELCAGVRIKKIYGVAARSALRERFGFDTGIVCRFGENPVHLWCEQREN